MFIKKKILFKQESSFDTSNFGPIINNQTIDKDDLNDANISEYLSKEFEPINNQVVRKINYIEFIGTKSTFGRVKINY